MRRVVMTISVEIDDDDGIVTDPTGGVDLFDIKTAAAKALVGIE
ncbi:MAG: hypothetical protein ACLUDU_14435 [Butyricimonas faecihominis]